MARTDDKVLQKVMGAFQSSRNDSIRRYKESVWIKSYKNWASHIERPIPRKSNLFVPLTFQMIEQMIAMEIGSIFNQDGIFRFGENDPSDASIADALSAYADYCVENEIEDSYQKIYTFLQNLHIEGTGILKAYWLFDFDQDAETGRVRIKADHFDIKPVSCRNFFLDPSAKSIQSAKWVVESSYVDDDAFRKLIATSEVAMAEKDVESVLGNRLPNALTSGDEFVASDFPDALHMDSDRKWVHIIEYFSVPEDRYIVVAGGRHVIRNTPLPWEHKKYPFVVAQDIPDPQTFWGRGTAEILMHQQAEINAKRNNRMDRSNFLTTPMFVANQGVLTNQSELIPLPGKIIRSQSEGDFKRLDMGLHYTAEEMEEERTIKGDMQAMTAINDYSMSTQFNATATGASMINATGQARIVAKLKYIEEAALKPLGKLWLSLQAQFAEASVFFSVAGKQYRVRPMDFRRNLRLSVTAATSIRNQQTRMNSITQAMQVVGMDPSVNRRELLKEVFRAAGLSPDRFMNPMPPGLPPGVGGMRPGMEGDTPPQAIGGPNPAADQMAVPDDGAMGAPGYDFIAQQKV